MRFLRKECLLQHWLDKKGMTQTELARLTDWKPRMVSKWCNNQAPMSVEAMYTVAHILEIDMKFLYTWEAIDK